jgi:predicted DNA-binding transcriptional regulator AlpA
MTKIIDTQKVAERVNRSVHTIRRWCKEDKIPHRRISKQTILFIESDIEAWLAGKMEEAK